MKKAFIVIGILVLIGVVYMVVKYTILVKDDTTYDINGSAQNSTPEVEGDEPSSGVVQDNKTISPTDAEIVARVYPEETYKKYSDNEYGLKVDAEIIGNTYILSSIVRGDLDRDLYTDAFVIAEITGAASVANTGYLVTRKGVLENFDGSTLEGRVLFDSAGFTSNKQLFVVFIQALTGEKERILYDYAVVNGEMRLSKISSKRIPPENPVQG